ncbi:hypothetical protein [Spectribacter hydrogenoxidans]|uniref:Lipoprotein n=1 Tax=Spectribacter hydrogenoxidans TaxID=3075608 RepID=A0ABU3C0Z4_9GAMM|nr:hypothetical protein [Salinisphaera sp. W335]MDT0635214.1 hypothetical protein [Salinisphaera sp. W335]
MSTAVRTRPSLFALLGLALLVSGCVNKTVKTVNAAPAAHAQEELSSEELVNVNIAVFEPGIPEDPSEAEEAGIWPEVREAESRYMAVALRQTLENTGYWGAVRVVPERVEYSELLVTGEIVESSGYEMALAVRAVDASGRVWLDQTYNAEAAELSYSQGDEPADPFQAVYNRIADDLLAARRARSAAELQTLRHLSDMRFAEQLAPEAFSRYVESGDGRYRLNGLPAEGDPLMARVERIRERDYALIDALDQHYRVFHDQIDLAYADWRAASYRETENLRELESQSLTRKLLGAAAVIAGIVGAANANNSVEGAASQVAIIGGIGVFASGLEKGRESKIHAEALEELGRSLESDVEPRNVQLANQTVTLSGSAEAQFEEWQQLMRDIYAAETGLIRDSGQTPASGDDDR